MLRSAFTLVALIGYASAQLNASGIPSDCENAVGAVIANKNAGICLGTASLFAVVTAGQAVESGGSGGSGETSFIADLNNWFNSICNAPKCSDSTLADVVKNITQGCASFLNITESNDNITSTVLKVYPTFRDLTCLKDNTQTSCFTKFLEGIQGFFSITLSSVMNFMDLINNVTLSNLPSNLTCTECNKAMIIELNKTFPSVVSDLTPPLASKCDTSFVDGVTPTGVVESASTSTAIPSSASVTAFGGVSLLSQGIITGLVVISALLLLP